MSVYIHSIKSLPNKIIIIRFFCHYLNVMERSFFSNTVYIEHFIYGMVWLNLSSCCNDFEIGQPYLKTWHYTRFTIKDAGYLSVKILWSDIKIESNQNICKQKISKYRIFFLKCTHNLNILQYCNQDPYYQQTTAYGIEICVALLAVVH